MLGDNLSIGLHYPHPVQRQLLVLGIPRQLPLAIQVRRLGLEDLDDLPGGVFRAPVSLDSPHAFVEQPDKWKIGVILRLDRHRVERIGDFGWRGLRQHRGGSHHGRGNEHLLQHYCSFLLRFS
jgi:hypothetical protein